MCGRVAQAKNPTEYGSMLKIDFTRGIPNAPAHYNGAPGQDYLIARSHPETHDITLDLIRWGLLPSWAKDRKIAWKLINARAETVATAAAFKKAFEKRRCLVPGGRVLRVEDGRQAKAALHDRNGRPVALYACR